MRRFLTAAALGLSAMSGRADAALISFAQQVVGSGSLGGASFTDATIIINAVADADDVVDAGGGLFQVENRSVSFLLEDSGGGTTSGTFLSPGSSFVRHDDRTFGIRLGTKQGDADVLVVEHPDFGSYDLAAAIGPLSGNPSITTGQAFATAFGDFVLTSITGDATFQASLLAAPVPEPASLATAAIAAGLLACARSLRRRPA
jgi:hypothetical protein